MTSKRVAAVTATVGGLLLWGLNAPTAEASSTVCKAARDVQAVCMTIGGEDGHVVNVSISGISYSTKAICDYSASIRTSIPGVMGPYPVWSEVTGPLVCSLGLADINIHIDRTFPTPSYVCGRFFIAGQEQTAEQCIKLTESKWPWPW
ncbi:hypothetical protein ACFYRY_08825 [Streptomyces sp. NPDC005263]|uniref:hypothetical protein n=1 Tax=Streptomyces sp. NPDC005263 TaxID=3364711 RepID=UPI00367C5F17